jgi:hypothetical protein
MLTNSFPASRRTFPRLDLFKKMLTRIGSFENFAPHTETNYKKMRTKALLLTAAISAVGLTSSMAQGTVFSVNAVGFVKVNVPTNFSIIANPLDNKASNGNTVSNLFAGAALADGTTIYKFDGSNYVINSAIVISPTEVVWDDPNMTLVPGEGAFIRNPGAGPFEVIFVGDVKTGSLSNALPTGFSLKSSQVPQSAPVNDNDANANNDLGFPAADGDSIYLFANGNYDIRSFADPDLNPATPDGIWDPSVPTPRVGEGFFVRKVAASSWNRTFNVNN